MPPQCTGNTLRRLLFPAKTSARWIAAESGAPQNPWFLSSRLPVADLSELASRKTVLAARGKALARNQAMPSSYRLKA
jgi:hypothetical protein